MNTTAAEQQMMQEERELLTRVMAKDARETQVFELGSLTTDMARGSEEKPGRITIAVDDAVVKNQKGPRHKAILRAFVVFVPTQVIERQSSRIIRP